MVAAIAGTLGTIPAGAYEADGSGSPAGDEAGYGVSTLENRVARLEKRLAGQQFVEMAGEIDRLQGEMKKLRGSVEELRYAYEKNLVQEQEKAAALERQNADLTERLRVLAPGMALQAGSAASPAPQTPSATGVGESPAAQPPEGQPVISLPVSSGSVPANPAESPVPAVIPAPAVSEMEPALREADYQRAFETLKQGRYADAISGFRTFINTYPAGKFSDSANYWLGEAYYVNRDLVAARETLRKMVADFPQSAKVPDANLKLGFIEYDNGQFAQAKTILSDLVKRYPNSSAARMAEKRLERMRLENH